MSGGVDSTILAIVALNLKSDFHAYTMNWPDSDKDRYNEDARNAALICKRLGINHFIVDMPKSTELPSLLKEYTYAMGEPNSNPSGISMMSLYSQISTNGFRLVITGDGADEILGGYERYQVINKLNKFPNLRFPKSEEIFHSLESKNNTFAKMMLGLIDSDSLMFWLYWQDLAKHTYLKKLYKDYQSDYFEIFQDDFQKIFKTKNKVASTMFKDLKIWLSMESNNKLDRISMFHSIEARSPFQSEKVIGSSIAEMAKGNFNKLEKKLLINNFPLLRSLPVNKAKLGFISPLGQWLRSSPELINESIKRLQVNFDFDNKELDRLIKSPSKGNYRDFRYLWNLIVLASWLEIK
jgi:asparagine synthase (glutamine-hydrolysing)